MRNFFVMLLVTSCLFTIGICYSMEVETKLLNIECKTKFDYRNKDADWKNSKDAIQRGMQKLKGGYPADAPYKMNK